MELKESPDSTFALFNLGMTLLDAAQPTEALNALCRSLQLADKGESHVRKIHALLVQCYWELNRLETAYWSCMQGLEAFPNDPELLFRKGSIEQSFGRLADAERSFLAAMSLRSDRHFSSLDIGIVGSKAWHNLAVIYTQQSRHAEAANAWKNAIQRGSHNRVAWRGYLEALSALGDKAGLSDAQSMCVASNVSSDILALVRARVLAENGNFQIAASVLEDALSRFDSLDLLEELCQTAFRGDLLDVAERRLS